MFSPVSAKTEVNASQTAIGTLAFIRRAPSENRRGRASACRKKCRARLMTLRRMKMALVKIGNRNHTWCGFGTMECRWQIYFPAPSVNDAAGEQDFNLRIRLKKLADAFERAGQILFVAIQVARMSPVARR
jgi:hypothetical protein